MVDSSRKKLFFRLIISLSSSLNDQTTLKGQLDHEVESCASFVVAPARIKVA